MKEAMIFSARKGTSKKCCGVSDDARGGLSTMDPDEPLPLLPLGDPPTTLLTFLDSAAAPGAESLKSTVVAATSGVLASSKKASAVSQGRLSASASRVRRMLLSASKKKEGSKMLGAESPKQGGPVVVVDAQEDDQKSGTAADAVQVGGASVDGDAKGALDRTSPNETSNTRLGVPEQCGPFGPCHVCMVCEKVKDLAFFNTS
ncbi:unnamed protein product [Amoebophrya sp. A25]|nr:unnamed protein product [Amoebophrya sp. A25]|eukprot:GSA25T00005732001.1